MSILIDNYPLFIPNCLIFANYINDTLISCKILSSKNTEVKTVTIYKRKFHYKKKQQNASSGG